MATEGPGRDVRELRATRRPWASAVVLLVGLAAPCLAADDAKSPPSWGGLIPGPHAVGFRSTWRADPSRAYNMTFDDQTTYAVGKAPRPILINLWYPAKPGTGRGPIAHGDYLSIATDEPAFSRFAAKLTQFERDVISRELADVPDAKLTGRKRQVLDAILATATASRRDAEPAAGRFPLVVYHSGHGSSFEDNAVLCELLASHGYVVIGGAFHDGARRYFNVGSPANSARDMEFLIAQASGLPFVDWGHIGVVGHSGGAQAALVFRSQEGSAIDAVVSLDTTEDYYSVVDRGWEYMTAPLAKNREFVTGPLLIAANAHAAFQLCDSLDRAERYYLTFDGIDHGDFISQGMAIRDFRARLAAADGAAPRRPPERDAYEALDRYILKFFNAHLKGDPAERASLTEVYKGIAIGTGPHVELAPAGATGPAPYRDDSGHAPTPRQLRPLLAARGVEATAAILRREHAREPHAPVFHETCGFALVYEWHQTGRMKEAAAIHKVYNELVPEYRGSFVREAFLYRNYGRMSRAADYYLIALALDPDDAAAAAGLKSLPAPDDAPKP